MESPPYHVHVDIQAAMGTLPPSIAGPSFADAYAARQLSDTLLDPTRMRPARLGRVIWKGQSGQLVLAPTGAAGGGEEAGHLIFFFEARGADYDISLHAWASKERFEARGGLERTITAPGTGAALPQVIQTLRSIVDSMIGS
jgi:hypothetical protein